MNDRFAVVQPGLEPLEIEKLTAAFRGVPGLTPYDARSICNEAGILCRGLSAAQASALQDNLKDAGVAVRIIAEAQLPVPPPPKFIRRVGITPGALMVEDLIRGMLPIPWNRVRLIAAGSVQLSKMARQQTVVEEIRLDFSGGLVPMPVRELKAEYSSKESADWFLRAEIIAAESPVSYSIEAERFLFASLGEGVTKDLASNFCLLIRRLTAQAPQAWLSRGAAAIVAEPPQFVYYPRKASFQDEIVWTLWQAGGGGGG